MPIIELFNQDCMDGMARYPDKHFELAICDPPYGISVNMNMGRRKGKRKRHEDKDWDESIPTADYFIELARVSKNQIIWGGNYFPLPQSKCFIIWDKAETMYGRDFAECEFAWGSFDKSARIFKQSPNQSDRIHPTQKPVKLYKWLLTNYAKPGDKILDTHLGSGSIAIACHDMGFDLTGYEIDKDYYDAACKRLKNHQMQATLF
jgi:site-specific DNA-methyltransferase (adenine-specific)